MFVMLNDGSSLEDLPTSSGAEIILLQRVWMFKLMSQGVAAALLHNAVFKDSKASNVYSIPSATIHESVFFLDLDISA